MNAGVQKIKEVIMTENTNLVSEILQSKANFENFIVNNPMPVEICEVMQEYQKKNTEKITDLTQNIQTFINKVGDENFNSNQYLVWVITNPKDEILNTMRVINSTKNDGLGIFVFKAFLNGDKIDFECLLKPELVVKKKREVNRNTPTKQMQKAYWEKYIEICDLSDYPDMQIKESAPQHYQFVSIGKAGVQILQTVNTQNNYIASEISIPNKKEIFEILLDNREEIEEKIGKLEWDSKEHNKSAKIRKIFNIDINDTKNHEKAILEHVKMGDELKAIVHKYL